MTNIDKSITTIENFEIKNTQNFRCKAKFTIKIMNLNKSLKQSLIFQKNKIQKLIQQDFIEFSSNSKGERQKHNSVFTDDIVKCRQLNYTRKMIQTQTFTRKKLTLIVFG